MGSNNLPRNFLAQLDDLQKRTGYLFNDPSLLPLAFTQKSSKGAGTPSKNNERLEFLGDAALNLLIGNELYREYPEAGEGFLTIERSKLVCGPNLSAWGYEAGFDGMISIGEGVDVSDAMVENAVEAVAGAFYLDGGLEAVKCFLQSFRDYPDQGGGFDSRRHLERDCKYEHLGTPHYETLPNLQKGRATFESVVTLDGKNVGSGVGENRDQAEECAARSAMMGMSRAPSEEHRKREAAFRARFRRILSRKTRTSSSPPSMSDAEREKQPAMVKDGVEYRIVSREGPEHKPLFVAAATRDGEKIAECRGPSKKGALKVLVREVEKAKENRSSREDDAFRDVDIASLRGSPEVKGCLQTCCERLGLGQPRYKDLPSIGKKNPTFFVELSLNGQTISSGSGASKRAAGQAAAWKILQLLAADHAGLIESQKRASSQLYAKLESAVKIVLEGTGVKNIRVESKPPQGENVARARVLAGSQCLTEVPGADEQQARVFALMKTVSVSHAWKPVFERLKIAKLVESPDSWRPDIALETWCRATKKSAPEILSMASGEKMTTYRVGIFVDGTLCAAIVAPNKKIAAAWLSLLLLDRVASGKPLVPDLKKGQAKNSPAKKVAAPKTSVSKNSVQKTSSQKKIAQKISVPKKPAEEKPKISIGKRIAELWRRMGELYTGS